MVGTAGIDNFKRNAGSLHEFPGAGRAVSQIESLIRPSIKYKGNHGVAMFPLAEGKQGWHNA